MENKEEREFENFQINKQFEEEISTYTGDDPLEPWSRYLVWYEKVYSKSEEYSDLLMKCINEMKHYDAYSNDLRFVKIWIAYADQSINAIEIYTFMHKQEIGNKLALLYITWAFKLCQADNIQEAITVLKTGITDSAQPSIDILEFLQELDPTFQPKNPVKDASKKLASTDPKQKKNKERVQNPFFDEDNFKFPVAYFEPFNPKFNPMYPKDKVYADDTEYSMEELRVFKIEIEGWKLQEKLKARKESQEISMEESVSQTIESLHLTDEVPQNFTDDSRRKEAPSSSFYEHTNEDSFISPQPNRSCFKPESPSSSKKRAMKFLNDIWGDETATEICSPFLRKKEQSLYLEPHSSVIQIDALKTTINNSIHLQPHNLEKENNYDFEAETIQNLHNKFAMSRLEEPPTNTNIFITNAKNASTPFHPLETHGRYDPNVDEPTIQALGIKSNLYKKREPQLESIDSVTASQELKDEPTLPQCLLAGENLSEIPPPPLVKTNLSTIMEGSNEDHSSASSGSGTLGTHGETTLKMKMLQTAQKASDIILEESGVYHTSFFNLEPTKRVNLFTEDAFDSSFRDQLLASIRNYLCSHPTFNLIDKKLPVIKTGEVKLENSTFIVSPREMKGSYGTVFCATKKSGVSTNNALLALKVSKEIDLWEYYICTELQKRLKGFMLPCVMKINEFYLYNNGQVLVSDFHKWGTLLDLVNLIKTHDMKFQETMIAYFAQEIFSLIEVLHEQNIIHADIKPDNFLIYDFPDKKRDIEKIFQTKCIKLIDFGRAIDMNHFPPNTAFTKPLTSQQFKCPEMLDGKPWSFHLDIYGALDTIHLLLFNEYISIHKVNGKWEIKKKLRRYWQISIWENLFKDLLNIPQFPEFSYLKVHSVQFIKFLERNSKSFFSEYETLKNLLNCSRSSGSSK